MIVKAPFIVSETGVLKNTFLRIEGKKITAMQKDLSPRPGEAVLDLPRMILFPGFINAHCHLELTLLPEPLPYPGSFTAWLAELGRIKLQMGPAAFREGIREGIARLLEGGITAVADHISPQTDPSPYFDSSLEGVLYAEVLGVEERRGRALFEAAKEMEKIHDVRNVFEIIPTPHAPYSLLPEIFRDVVLHHGGKKTPLSIHIAESEEERRLFTENRGPLHDLLSRLGKTPPARGETPMGYLKRLGILPRGAMAVHANTLTDGDIVCMKESELSVVHCPGSHDYFGHDRFPLGPLLEAGIPVALGTDSLASNPSLSMFEQMRLLTDNFAEVTPRKALEMATREGARALRRDERIGTLAEGKQADIAGVTLRFPKRDVYENILLSEKAEFLMIRGNTVTLPTLPLS